jgi:hypothetical protein
MKYQILFILLALLSLSAPLGASVIYVSGAQTGIWSADTVIVTAEVRVPPGETLVINPGVEVYFQTNCKFIVDNGAALSAVGTLSDSILFDEHWSLPGNGWKGIRFLSASSSSQLQYCHLTNGFASGSGEDAKGGAIYCSSSSPTIQYCLINAAQPTLTAAGFTVAHPIPASSVTPLVKMQPITEAEFPAPTIPVLTSVATPSAQIGAILALGFAVSIPAPRSAATPLAKTARRSAPQPGFTAISPAPPSSATPSVEIRAGPAAGFTAVSIPAPHCSTAFSGKMALSRFMSPAVLRR